MQFKMEAKTKTLRIGIKNQNKRIYYTVCKGDKKLECYSNLEEKNQIEIESFYL